MLNCNRTSRCGAAPDPVIGAALRRRLRGLAAILFRDRGLDVYAA
jgi:hypothetical protein